ncbi:MAG: DNA topoisomerase [Persephonella sp.]|nr:DNA topoisomerase [Persephonella sp.]
MVLSANLQFVPVEEKGEKKKSNLFVKPFTTDLMLSEAGKGAQVLRLKKQMQLAQDLFEAGLITYHRTDSFRVSEAGVLWQRSI